MVLTQARLASSTLTCAVIFQDLPVYFEAEDSFFFLLMVCLVIHSSSSYNDVRIIICRFLHSMNILKTVRKAHAKITQQPHLWGGAALPSSVGGGGDPGSGMLPASFGKFQGYCILDLTVQGICVGQRLLPSASGLGNRLTSINGLRKAHDIK